MNMSIYETEQSTIKLIRSVIPDAEADGRINLGIMGPFTRFERALVYHLARDHFTGKGDFVELGSFVGASTQAFAAGLLDNTASTEDRKVIHAYDLFRKIGNWDTGYQDRALVGSEDESFLRTFLANLDSLRKYIVFHEGDILQAKPPSDGAIELLFVDICKTEKIMIYIAETFFPRLSVGSIYIQQDYLFWGMPFIKAFHEFIWDYLEVELVLTPTIVFRVVKPFDLTAEIFQQFRDMPQADKAELIKNNGKRFGKPYEELFQKSFDLFRNAKP